MKRYPVGTRVRLIKAYDYPEMLGAEGTIVGDAPAGSAVYQVEAIAYAIDLPDYTGPNGTTCWDVPHSAIVPILNEYDGHETTTWDECPWQPEEVKV